MHSCDIFCFKEGLNLADIQIESCSPIKTAPNIQNPRRYIEHWYTVRPATALFLVPGIYSAIENSANGGSCYLVSCKFLQKIVL